MPLAAVVVVLLAVGALAACDDSGDEGRPRRSTTTSSSSTTSSSTTTTSTTVASSPPTIPTTPPVNAGTCGTQTDAIVAAIGGTDVGGLNTRQGQFSVQNCRLAPSSPIWAAAEVIPNPGVTADVATVVLERVGALWTVLDLGTAHLGCDAPANVQSELGLDCTR